jgi:protocatechuate 3,4-dioxygenase beta subunit
MLMVACWAAGPTAQPAGVLAGRVLELGASTETPVARATVSVDAGDGSGERLAVTDNDGRFRFVGLPDGRYLVRATKSGWVTTFHGSPRPGHPPGVRVAVQSGRPASIDIAMARGGVIAGRIVDHNGEPMPRQFPWLLESRLVGDQPMLSRMRGHITIGTFERSTNDLGEFRLFGLPPGTYYLAVSPTIVSGTRVTTDAEVRWAMAPPGAARTEPPPAAPVAGYARLYYPGTPDPDGAAAIVVGPGQVREGLEFRVEFTPVSRLEGVVRRPDGTPAAGARVMLEAREPRVNLEGMVRTAAADPQGRFAFTSVAPDTYRLAATGSTEGTTVRDLWTQTDVTAAGADITNLALTLAPASQITGRAVFTGSTRQPPTDLTTVRVMATGVRARAQALAGGGSSLTAFEARLAADGTFRMVGLPPDRYLLSTTWPGMRTDAGGWWLADITVANRTLGDVPLTVAPNAVVSDVVLQLRDRIGAVEGTLTDQDGRPAPGYVVLAFPIERESWTTVSRRVVPPVRPATDGRFVVSGLPAGEYYLAVVTSVDSEEAADPRFLEGLVPQALRVRVPEGATVQQNVRIGR